MNGLNNEVLDNFSLTLKPLTLSENCIERRLNSTECFLFIRSGESLELDFILLELLSLLICIGVLPRETSRGFLIA
jgi:hypothetical protein